MNAPTKRIITITAEYNIPNDLKAATLTDKDTVEKLLIEQMSDALFNEWFESIEVTCEDI